MLAALVLAAAGLVGPLASQQAPAMVALTPDARSAGQAMGRTLLGALEEEDVQLRPGPVLVELSGEAEAARIAREGLEEVLGRRGFRPWRPAEDSEPAVLRLALEAHPLAPGWRFILSCREAGGGRWQVDAADKAWVLAQAPPAARLRAHGEWAGGPDEALAGARLEASTRLHSWLAGALPWRPWRDRALARLVRAARLEEDAFVERRETRSGSIWRGAVCWRAGAEERALALRMLEREDRRWLLRCSGGFLAALLLWGLGARLDWATRGFFTGRVRLLMAILWLMACGILGILV